MITVGCDVGAAAGFLVDVLMDTLALTPRVTSMIWFIPIPIARHHEIHTTHHRDHVHEHSMVYIPPFPLSTKWCMMPSLDDDYVHIPFSGVLVHCAQFLFLHELLPLVLFEQTGLLVLSLFGLSVVGCSDLMDHLLILEQPERIVRSLSLMLATENSRNWWEPWRSQRKLIVIQQNFYYRKINGWLNATSPLEVNKRFTNWSNKMIQ